MSIQRLQSHWGFSRMPFGRDLAPSMLHRHPGHSEAIARISWCVDQCAIGVITGEVGAGKTVAIRAAATALDPARHVIIYLANPTIGVRGMLTHIVAALGHTSNCQYLWIGVFQATSVPVGVAGLSAGSGGVMSTGRSSSLPLWNTAPARTRATRCGAFTARQRACAASMSL